MAAMWRSEVSALRWSDVADFIDGDGMLVTVRRGKTNQEGEVNDTPFVKDGVARALRTLIEGSDELAHVAVASDAPETLLRFQWRTRHPALEHLTAAPALHVAPATLHAAVEVLDDVRRP